MADLFFHLQHLVKNRLRYDAMVVLKLSALCLRRRMIKEANEYVPFDEKSHPPHQLTQEDLLYPCNLYYLC